MSRSSLTWILAAAALAACGGDDESTPADGATIDGAGTDAAIDAGTDAAWVEPTLLSQTGLYSDIGTKTVAADVIEFKPRWELWSDAAVKRRWIWLPPGAQIDTTADMDFWSFPTGTKLWKEFVRDGKRIETRLLEKTGTADDVSSWYMVAFQWDATEADGTAVPGGVVDDLGVNDIPARSDCRKCHGPNRNPAVVLGIGALQMDYDAPAGNLDLAALVAADRLTTAPTAGGGGAYFPLPEVGAGDPALPALGYLHANCGGCHNPRSDVQNTVPLELRLATAAGQRASWAATATYVTAVNVAASLTGQGTHVVKGGDTAQSALFNRMTSTGGVRMPPIGREVVDAVAVETLRTWINALPAPQ